MPAPTSVPSATRTPCARWRFIGNSPLPRNALLEGQCATGARGGEPAELRVGGVDVVGEHAARPDEREALVGVEVVARPREELRDEGDLVRVLVDVAGEETPSCSLDTAAHASSIASVQESEKRGVTA